MPSPYQAGVVTRRRCSALRRGRSFLHLGRYLVHELLLMFFTHVHSLKNSDEVAVTLECVLRICPCLLLVGSEAPSLLWRVWADAQSLHRFLAEADVTIHVNGDSD